MNKQHILIVEDEEPIAEVLEVYCKGSGYDTTHFSEGSLVASYVRQTPPNLILLDLMLPDKNGLDIFKEIRMFSSVPVIMVTAKVEDIDRLLGLELGADDYICKPFVPREVIARIKAVLRRTESPKQVEENYSADSNKFIAFVKGIVIDLTPKEFKLFNMFCAHPGQVFSRGQIIDKVYSLEDDICDRNIDTHVKNIRKKINSVDSECNPIISVYGVGYKFDPCE